MNDTKNMPKIEETFELTQDELLINIGRELEKKKLYSSHPSNQKLIESALSWLSMKRNILATIICSNLEMKEYLSDPIVERRVDIASVIGDILASNFTGIPVITISVFLLKEGLEQLCEGEEK